MKIPSKFTIHGHEIKVIQREIDSISDNRYGYYNNAKEEIVIFRKVRSNEEVITLTDTEATFYHELVHCFQWHIKGETDEWEAQSYSGLIIEFLKSKIDNGDF